MRAPVDHRQRYPLTMLEQHDGWHGEKPVEFPGDPRQPWARPVFPPQLDGQKDEGFDLVRGVMDIHRDSALPFGQAGNVLPGDLEQERTTAPAGNLGLVPIEAVRIRDVGEEFSRRVAEVGGMVALIAQLGQESGRGIFQRTVLKISQGRLNRAAPL